MNWTRRQLLQAGGALAGVAAAGLPAAPARSQDTSRRIALLNLHTDERISLEYFRAGVYAADAMSAIEVLLRDYRTGDRHAIDPKLMDYLVDVARAARVDASFSVISGYRSPQTNAHLRDLSTGVAQHSLHMEGRAIDVRSAAIDCANLAAHAEDLQRGGVGYYRGSNFVHLDTGKFRTWKG
jgi:uncharacterized protein YcbK (DUF882 family)